MKEKVERNQSNTSDNESLTSTKTTEYPALQEERFKETLKCSDDDSNASTSLAESASSVNSRLCGLKFETSNCQGFVLFRCTAALVHSAIALVQLKKQAPSVNCGLVRMLPRVFRQFQTHRAHVAHFTLHLIVFGWIRKSSAPPMLALSAVSNGSDMMRVFSYAQALFRRNTDETLNSDSETAMSSTVRAIALLCPVLSHMDNSGYLEIPCSITLKFEQFESEQSIIMGDQIMENFFSFVRSDRFDRAAVFPRTCGESVVWNNARNDINLSGRE
ncbi:hypothetical protein EAG_11169 [Camponotus floridanus]|uniref:Uncharacterized protein n=1 Tax=Camponotus floridanus TaxID=104421 RepID=E2A874_CAMFO|nr:hypothetical protein EAG_11169 [Camponotus floridanus]